MRENFYLQSYGLATTQFYTQLTIQCTTLAVLIYMQFNELTKMLKGE